MWKTWQLPNFSTEISISIQVYTHYTISLVITRLKMCYFCHYWLKINPKHQEQTTGFLLHL